MDHFAAFRGADKAAFAFLGFIPMSLGSADPSSLALLGMTRFPNVILNASEESALGKRGGKSWQSG
jgi:hypothetical protein